MGVKIAKKKTKASGGAKKSGIKHFNAGDVLFHENDVALSLFIIQSGQVRLYKPKGKGFIDLAVLRKGEVIGEMAYFDTQSRRRSCSAAAIVGTDVIEISFAAFEKTMSGLNPWFKTIINTLADRLRKTNDKVKELEGNSVGYGSGGKAGTYVFFHNADIIKIISTLYLAVKNHGKKKELHHEIHMNHLKFYMFDVYSVPEVKFEEFLNVMKEQSLIRLGKDEDGLLKMVQIENPESLRKMVVFFNTQRLLEEEKKLRVSKNCAIFLKYIIAQLKKMGASKARAEVDISEIVEMLKADGLGVDESDLKDAVDAGLCEDIVVGTGNKLTSVVNYEQIQNTYPCIVMMNAVNQINEEKAADGKGGY